MKKMKQEEKQERESPGNLKAEVISLVISSKTFFAIASDPDVIESNPYYSAVNTGIPVDRSADIFHPPLVS